MKKDCEASKDDKIFVPGNNSGIELSVLGGKGTPSMFDPVLQCLMSQGQGLTFWEGLLEALHAYF
jgi:hypothetical protein